MNFIITHTLQDIFYQVYLLHIPIPSPENWKVGGNKFIKGSEWPPLS